MRFDEATAVTRVDEGRYTATVQDGWDIGGNANGGYLMAMAGRAMADTAGRPPLTLTGHYLRPAPAADCEIETSVIKTGRRIVTVSATLSIGGKPTLTLLGAFGEQTRGGPAWRSEEPIDLATWDELAPDADPSPIDVPSLVNQVDLRMRHEDRGFRLGEPSGKPEMHGWFALADDEPMDVFTLLLAADAYPPPLFNSGLPVAWAPTVELTVHIRGIPAPGPLRCSFRSRFIQDGLTDEEGEIWDSSGALVCQARQLALMPLPPD